MRVQMHSTDFSKCAAEENQLHICQYLLGQATWPDHAAVLNHALGRYMDSYGWSISRHRIIEAYRLFTGVPEFDFGIENIEQGLSCEWLNNCRVPLIPDFVSRWMPFDADSTCIQTRFEVAMQLGIVTTTSTFLECVGMQASNPKLACLRTKHKGRTVLHYVARRLWDLRLLGFSEQAMEEWVDLGVAVLKNGANPSSIAKEIISYNLDGYEKTLPRVEWSLTPLLDFMNVSDWDLICDTKGKLLDSIRLIQIWAEMMQKAGIDLCQYGAKEREIWKCLPEKTYGSRCRPWRATWTVSELVYGSTPEQWGFKVQNREQLFVQTFERGRLPGEFPEDRDVLPRKITWKPTLKEMDEGPWEKKECLQVPSQSVDLRDILSSLEYKEAFTELLETTQDDNGAISMMQYRASREKLRRSRSHSQPPPTCLRTMAFSHNFRDAFARPGWFPDYHKSPFDSKWSFHCCNGASSMDLTARSCVEGSADGPSSVQGSWAWENDSFLAEIANCQDGRIIWHNKDLKHTGTADCPWNCGVVKLERLNVPEALRWYHPEVISARYEQYRVR